MIPTEGVRRGIAARYAAGETLEALALDWETHARVVRAWISPYVEIRPRGTRTPLSGYNDPTREARADRPTGVRATGRNPRRRRSASMPGS
jgi:hypothetical protein